MMYASQQYLESRVLYASPLELIVMLYEKAIEVLDTAEAATQQGDVRQRGDAIGHALRIIQELQLSLREQEGEDISGRLRELYWFAQQQLLEATAKAGELLAIQQVRLLMMNLLDAWRIIAAPAEAVSYAGSFSADA